MLLILATFFLMISIAMLTIPYWLIRRKIINWRQFAILQIFFVNLSFVLVYFPMRALDYAPELNTIFAGTWVAIFFVMVLFIVEVIRAR